MSFENFWERFLYIPTTSVDNMQEWQKIDRLTAKSTRTARGLPMIKRGLKWFLIRNHMVNWFFQWISLASESNLIFLNIICHITTDHRFWLITCKYSSLVRRIVYLIYLIFFFFSSSFAGIFPRRVIGFYRNRLQLLHTYIGCKPQRGLVTLTYQESRKNSCFTYNQNRQWVFHKQSCRCIDPQENLQTAEPFRKARNNYGSWRTSKYWDLCYGVYLVSVCFRSVLKRRIVVFKRIK